MNKQLTTQALKRRIALSDLIEPCGDESRNLGTLLGLEFAQEQAELGFARDTMLRKSQSKRDARKRDTRRSLPAPN